TCRHLAHFRRPDVQLTFVFRNRHRPRAGQPRRCRSYSLTLTPYAQVFSPPGRASFPSPSLLHSCSPSRRSSTHAYKPEPLVEGHYVYWEIDDWSRRSGRLIGRRRAARDRKSTRLNSSHVAISYAVFCLKKKTNKYC